MRGVQPSSMLLSNQMSPATLPIVCCSFTHFFLIIGLPDHFHFLLPPSPPCTYSQNHREVGIYLSMDFPEPPMVINSNEVIRRSNLWNIANTARCLCHNIGQCENLALLTCSNCHFHKYCSKRCVWPTHTSECIQSDP